MNPSTKKILKKIGCVLGLIIGVIYILNPTFGVFELIPDNLPYIGNLDEASAVILIMACLKELRKKEEDPPEDQGPKNEQGTKLNE